MPEIVVTNQRVDFKCFKCEKVGHIARNCRSNLKDRKHGHQSHKKVVIEGDNKPLLGKQSAESLGVLKIEINSINSDNIVDKYPNITKKNLEDWKM